MHRGVQMTGNHPVFLFQRCPFAQTSQISKNRILCSASDKSSTELIPQGHGFKQYWHNFNLRFFQVIERPHWNLESLGELVRFAMAFLGLLMDHRTAKNLHSCPVPPNSHHLNLAMSPWNLPIKVPILGRRSSGNNITTVSSNSWTGDSFPSWKGFLGPLMLPKTSYHNCSNHVKLAWQPQTNSTISLTHASPKPN